MEHGSFPKLHLQNKRKHHSLRQAIQMEVDWPISTRKRRYSFGVVEMFFHFGMFYHLNKNNDKKSHLSPLALPCHLLGPL